jgi:GTP cyclohydrolase IA
MADKKQYEINDQAAIVKNLLKTIGENPDREGLQDTPERVARMWKEIFKGYDPAQKPKVTVFDNGHDGLVYDEMIMDTGEFYSHCEHHMVPFFGKYYFAYIPHPNGKILGLSKVARVVDYYSSKLQVQERLVHEIVDYLWNELCTKNEKGNVWTPIAMGLVIDGEHLCKTMRGVKKKGKMRTSELRGVIKTDSDARHEFLSWVNSNGHN